MLTKITLNESSIIQQSQGYIVSNMGDEKVMMGIENGNYYNLGEMGGVIWDKLQQPITFRQLVHELASEYEIQKEDCRNQVMSFLDSLITEGLIHIKK